MEASEEGAARHLGYITLAQMLDLVIGIAQSGTAGPTTLQAAPAASSVVP